MRISGRKNLTGGNLHWPLMASLETQVSRGGPLKLARLSLVFR
jgi:hypothetical protein